MHIGDPEQVIGRYPFELSGGMRQRVLIGLAFSCEPELIIADEPTTALDVTVQRQVLRLLNGQAKSSGTAVLFITHDMAVVAQLCDRVYVMYAGHVIESGNTDEVITSPAHPYSIGLLQAAPENGEPRSLLKAIPGTVPNLAQTACRLRLSRTLSLRRCAVCPVTAAGRARDSQPAAGRLLASAAHGLHGR